MQARDEMWSPSDHGRWAVVSRRTLAFSNKPRLFDYL